MLHQTPEGSLLVMKHHGGAGEQNRLGAKSMDLKPEDFVKRLEEISEYKGIPYSRANLLIEAEEKHAQAVLQYKGFLALSNSFKCFVLETIELLNKECITKLATPMSEPYVVFIPRFSQSFLSLCGSEKAAINGYPYQGYTQLRNVFDNLILACAVLQKEADIYSIEGIEPGKPIDPIAMKKHRKNTEYKVRKRMTGSKSGLSKQTINELSKLDALFDYETHGARLSLTQAMNWMKGLTSLPILPNFDQSAFAMFMNRFLEVGWMIHRLIPNVQPSSALLPVVWQEKWRIIDDSFERAVGALSSEGGKKIGAAFVEFIKAKFPYNENSCFPL